MPPSKTEGTVGKSRTTLSRYEMQMLAKFVAAEVCKMLAGQQQPEKWLTVKEAADYAKCSISRIYKKKAEIPHVKDGHSLKFTKEGLSEWIKGNR